MKIGEYYINKLSNSKNVITKNIAGNRDWYEKSWGGVLSPLFIVGYSCVEILNQRVPGTFCFGFCFVKDDKMSWFWSNRDIKK